MNKKWVNKEILRNLRERISRFALYCIPVIVSVVVIVLGKLMANFFRDTKYIQIILFICIAIFLVFSPFIYKWVNEYDEKLDQLIVLGELFIKKLDQIEYMLLIPEKFNEVHLHPDNLLISSLSNEQIRKILIKQGKDDSVLVKYFLKGEDKEVSHMASISFEEAKEVFDFS